MKILRPVFAIIAGIIVMVVVVALVEAVGHAMFPPPQEVIDTVMAYYEVSTTGDPETVAAAREAGTSPSGTTCGTPRSVPSCSSSPRGSWARSSVVASPP